MMEWFAGSFLVLLIVGSAWLSWFAMMNSGPGQQSRGHDEFKARAIENEQRQWLDFLTGLVFVYDAQGCLRDVNGDIKNPRQASSDPVVFANNPGDYWTTIINIRCWEAWRARAEAQGWRPRVAMSAEDAFAVRKRNEPNALLTLGTTGHSQRIWGVK